MTNQDIDRLCLKQYKKERKNDIKYWTKRIDSMRMNNPFTSMSNSIIDNLNLILL